NGEVYLVSPSALSPGPTLFLDQVVLTAPSGETDQQIVAGSAGSTDTLIAVLLREEDALGVENTGRPFLLSEQQVIDLERDLRAFMEVAPNQIEIVTHTYYVIH